jgi:alcohol dehydrogenase class IV
LEMKFEFATSARILFGPGRIRDAAELAREYGRHALLVSGHLRPDAGLLADDLRRQGVDVTFFEVTSEPDIALVETAARFARSAGCDLVIGFGGGSVLDAAKAMAALATNPGGALEYLEVIGKGRALEFAPLPIIAIPTTAGTGSEVTRNAVVSSPEKQVKVSLRHNLLLPRLAIIDPLLTHSLPPDVTASTGMDALTQVIEPYLSLAANPLTDGFCEEGITRAARSLKKAFQDGNDASAREDMALAGLLGGLALANARLGAVHGFAGPLGGMFPAPHGQVCARLLPIVMKVNLRAVRERRPDPGMIIRFERIAKLLTGNPNARAEAGISWLEETCGQLKIPALRVHGVRAGDIPKIVDQARSASSMKGNPIELTEKELAEIIQSAL